MANRLPRPILLLLLILVVLGLVGQAVPLYTDWLWFQEVGYAGVFVTILTLRGWLFLGVGLGTFLFLYLNLTLAARTAGLSKHVVVSEKRFVGRAIERDDITEHSAMLGLQIAELPVDTF
jgi:uncharacterized membrane protein (UPF0182 family)